MSVCDEGWVCPCLHHINTCGEPYYACGFQNIRFLPLVGMPDSCPHAAALRAVVEDPTLVLVAVPKEVHYLEGFSEMPLGILFQWHKEFR